MSYYFVKSKFALGKWTILPGIYETIELAKEAIEYRQYRHLNEEYRICFCRKIR